MSNHILQNKIVVVLGPTSSGKSELAVKLAKKFNGHIISCDSRQIYKGLNLGTGKVEGKWKKVKVGKKLSTVFMYKSVPHYCIDYINPKRSYSVARFQADAKNAINNVLEQGKLPILCGGTAHYIDAVVFDQNLPDVKPQPKLRAKLEKQSAEVLLSKLTKLDPIRAQSIDRFNKRRIIRALEIVVTSGSPVPQISNHKSSILYPLWLGISAPQPILYKKIEARLKQRIKDGMIKEVKNLRSNGLSWRRLESFGLEYRYISLYLQKKMNYNEMFEQLLYAIKHYSKRQMTWWKRNKGIKWINPNYAQAAKLSKSFLSI